MKPADQYPQFFHLLNDLILIIILHLWNDWKSDIRIVKTKKLNTLRALQEPVLFITFITLDKLLGRLGIYATWLSSIAYLQKQLCIFIFFMPRFFL